MFSNEWLSDLLLNPNVTTTQKLMVILLNVENPGYSSLEIKKIALAHGASDAKKWGIHGFLNAAKDQGKVKSIDQRWSLTNAGRVWLAEQGIIGDSVILKKRDDVRRTLDRIANLQTRNYLIEAITCLEAGALRASVILSWIGAMSILYDHVFAKHLAAFNAEAANHSRNKWKPAVIVDDLCALHESAFLEAIENIHIIGQSEKKLLKICLDWRNSSGHPNEAVISEQHVAAHIETLVNVVYSKYP